VPELLASMLMAAGDTIKQIMAFMATPTFKRSSATSSCYRSATSAPRASGWTPTSARAAWSYFESPLWEPRVSPCIGLGLIGCGVAVGAGLVAMALILRPLGQRHDPGRDLDDENDEADPSSHGLRSLGARELGDELHD
jgi:hypothetical protein